MRRPAAIAISAMLAGTVFVAAAPLAFADDGHGDHDKCTAGMACSTARPTGDEHREHAASATPAAPPTVNTEGRDADVDENENENDVDGNETENDDNDLDRDENPGAAATASPTATPTATASPGNS